MAALTDDEDSRERCSKSWTATPFRSESEQIGDFLGASEKVSLSALVFYTSQSCNPNHPLQFTRLKHLVIEFRRCSRVCSSRVDDDIIINLAWAMPKLEVLEPGK